jgi:uncharacterized membrane protein YhhN
MFRLFNQPVAEIASKMIASSAFIALALVSGALRTRYGMVVLAALVFSWIGDLLLTGESGQYFLFGLISFLLAHVMYIAAFWIRGIDRTWFTSALLPIALISVATSVWLTPHVSAGMLMPVRIYTVVISLMVIAAFGARGAGASVFLPVGAILFYLSDLSVAAGQFVQPAFPNYVWGLPFYFGGQVLLAMSVRHGPSFVLDSRGTHI